ncbi:helix-turn-helix domain-containing protein [Alicyclobacillus sp. SO9]|uniref:helix-turn-helix domain-containing protein n=1 Tax=Alicyclobacillus sp. SO9 TaxID=2665646 RepID=UPI0018E70938|nr:helix-turn-helix domain-containing protein [Alicyclobacillus sp. SO9]QQE81605.1 helix-turn-helix domain-containing protein [Alicyclobacillus sp. SO9]
MSVEKFLTELTQLTELLEKVTDKLERIASTHSEDHEFPAVLRIQDAMKILGVGRNTMYKLVKQPGFPARQFDKVILIPRDRLFEWLDETGRGPSN